MSQPFLTKLFSSANLFDALSNEGCSSDEVAAQPRAQYLLGYLTQLSAKSIVIECEYTDGDYLEDFASFYVRSFKPYNRKCKRLHFFDMALDEELLANWVQGNLSQQVSTDISEAYLGFVVARPLPSAIVGRTILKTYDSDGGRRRYTVVRNYAAHVFGVDLTVRSLPYQEQDSVLAACATVALWSAFHKTAELFGTSSPRPAVITRGANLIGHRGRPVPSHGLRIEEMCHAVSREGLEPELVECEGNADIPLVSLLYGHLAMGLPVILVVRIGEGLHAITLTGYSIRDTRVRATEGVTSPSIPMVGLRIDEFYGHDDQIGPFARLTVAGAAGEFPAIFHGSWINEATGSPFEIFPTAVLIPVYNKIRVTFLDIQEWLTRLNTLVSMLVPTPELHIEWDLHLITSNDLKKEIRSTTLPADIRHRLLVQQQPRFLWRAKLRVGGAEAFDVLFDATDMARSFPFQDLVWHDARFKAAMTKLLTANALQPDLNEWLTPRLLRFLKGNL